MFKYIFKKNTLVYFFILFLFIFILNLGFFLTDFLAGKTLSWKILFYSSISNETWLLFWGSFSASIATILLLLHYKEQLNFEKNKYHYEVKLNNLSKEKAIILNLLSVYDIADISNYINVYKGNLNNHNYSDIIFETHQYKTKELNAQRLELEFLTSIRICNETLDENFYLDINFYDMNTEQKKQYCYILLNILHNFYCTLIDDLNDRCIEYLEEENNFKGNKELAIKTSDSSYEKIFLGKNLTFITFIDNNLFFLKDHFNQATLQFNIFKKDIAAFEDNCNSFELNPEEIDFIKYFIYNIHKTNIDLNNLDLKNLFSHKIFIIVFNSFFREVTDCLTNYYHSLEQDIKNSF